MHLIIGGKYQGKLDYAINLYGSFSTTYNLSQIHPSIINQSGLIINVHLGVKTLLTQNISPCEFFLSKIEFLRQSVIIGDEINSGIIPINEFERKYRDQTGKLYQILAHEADIVDRIFAGLPLRLKGA